jgi:hypothetical protein
MGRIGNYRIDLLKPNKSKQNTLDSSSDAAYSTAGLLLMSKLLINRVYFERKCEEFGIFMQRYFASASSILFINLAALFALLNVDSGAPVVERPIGMESA